MTKRRINGLVDAVFGIVLTLVVVSTIAFPTFPGPLSNVSIISSLFSLIPNFIIYIIAFLLLSIFLKVHYEQFHLIARMNAGLFWLTILWLMFVSLVPFSTYLNGEYSHYLIPKLIFHTNMLIVFLLAAATWAYATRAKLLNKSVKPSLIKLMRARMWVAPAVTLVAIATTFISPGWSSLSYLLIPLVLNTKLSSRKAEYYGWMTKGRIETLVDGVFAIVMTVLVVSTLTVPHLTGALNSSAFINSLYSLWPNFQVYIIAFLLLAIFLSIHHQQFSRIVRANVSLFWLNMFWLMFITLMPLSTYFIGEYGNFLVPVLFFHFNMLAVCLLTRAISWYSIKHKLVARDFSPSERKLSSRRTLISPATALVGIAVAFVSPAWSPLVYIVIPFVMRMRFFNKTK